MNKQKIKDGREFFIKIREGDYEAYEEFWDIYNKTFVKIFKQYGLNEDEMFEKVSLIILNENLNIRKIIPYMKEVAKNEAIKLYKYKKRNLFCSDLYEDILIAEDNSNLEFEGYIKRFDERTQEIFRLRFIEGYTYQKIADIFDTYITDIYRTVKKHCELLKSSMIEQ